MPEMPDDLIELVTVAVGQSPRPLCRLFAQEWSIKDEGHRSRARDTANRFYEIFKEALRPYLAEMQIPDLVEEVTRLRNAGKEDERVLVDMWLMARFPPQRITGVLNRGY